MVRCGLIGFGGIAQNHVRGYMKLKDVELVVSDVTPERLQLAKEKLKIGEEHLYRDYKEMLKKEKLDFVDICLPVSLHAEASIAAAKSGVHVLVEKPLAKSLSEIDLMTKSAKENGVKLWVGHNYHYAPNYEKIKEIIDKGTLGKIVYSEINMKVGPNMFPVPFGAATEYNPFWRTDYKMAGGGPLIDLGVHQCYLNRWFAGSDATRVSGIVDKLTREDDTVEDFGHMFYNFENGMLFELGVAWSFNVMRSENMIYGKKGAILALDFMNPGPIQMTVWGKEEKVAISRDPEFMHMFGDIAYSFVGMLRDVVSDVMQDKRPRNPIYAEDGKKAMEMILGAYEAGVLRSEVKLPLRKSDPVYQKGTAGLCELDLPRDCPIFAKKMFT